MLEYFETAFEQRLQAASIRALSGTHIVGYNNVECIFFD